LVLYIIPIYGVQVKCNIYAERCGSPGAGATSRSVKKGKSQKTIEAYSWAVRRVSEHFDCWPDQLAPEQLEIYFARLVESHSWSTVKVDRNGLQFYWRYVLKLDWQWVNIIKPPKIHTIPDILTPVEIEQLIGKTRKLHVMLI